MNCKTYPPPPTPFLECFKALGSSLVQYWLGACLIYHCSYCLESLWHCFLSVAIGASHFLCRRIWTLPPGLTAAASLSASQQRRRGAKQEGTAHFVRFSQTKTPMAERIRSPGEIEKMLLVKHPHLDRGYLCFWEGNICGWPRAGPTDAGIWGCCEIYNGQSLILSHKMKIEKNKQPDKLSTKIFFITIFLITVTCTCHGHWRLQ